MVHEAAAAGFSRGAWDYEKGRPGYPVDAVGAIVEEFAIGPTTSVVDLGAGTGKFTRLLVPTGARILAVEPVVEMREVFTSALPGVEIVDGTAEAIPARDESVDVVTAAQMFHWVDALPALDEVHRVLRPGGGIAFIWNSRDESAGWTARIQELMDRAAGGAPRYGSAGEGRWEDVIMAHAGFGPLRRATYRLEHPTNIEATLARVASTSYVSALPDDDRASILDEVRAIVADEGFGDAFVEPYVTEVFLCRKR